MVPIFNYRLHSNICVFRQIHRTRLAKICIRETIFLVSVTKTNIQRIACGVCINRCQIFVNRTGKISFYSVFIVEKVQFNRVISREKRRDHTKNQLVIVSQTIIRKCLAGNIRGIFNVLHIDSIEIIAVIDIQRKVIQRIRNIQRFRGVNQLIVQVRFNSGKLFSALFPSNGAEVNSIIFQLNNVASLSDVEINCGIVAIITPSEGAALSIIKITGPIRYVNSIRTSDINQLIRCFISIVQSNRHGPTSTICCAYFRPIDFLIVLVNSNYGQVRA